MSNVFVRFFYFDSFLGSSQYLLQSSLNFFIILVDGLSLKSP